MPGNLEDALALAALCQCLVKYLSDDIDHGAYQFDCHPMMVRQNKWRACRFGNQAALVNSYTYKVQSVSEIVHFLVEKLQPVADELDCAKYLQHCETMSDRPSWADRQRELMAQTGNPVDVVRRLAAEARISPVPAAT
jgi:carboxylate-amine ligase